jgi:enoyl-CoA hydratase
MTSPSPAAAHQTGTDRLLVEVTGPVATVTFNNPRKRNAFSADMRAALPGVLRALNADGEVRVIVVTGAGHKAFASGADISEFGEQRTSPDARASFDQSWAAVNGAWASLDKPVIAMIRGFCMGRGLLTALEADIRIASDDSQFGIPAARLGLGYSVSGVTALQMGLVNRVVPADSLLDAVLGLADSIARNAPLTVAAAKAAIREVARPDGRGDLARVEAMIEACFRSADYREGQRAFAEKRPPDFSGR